MSYLVLARKYRPRTFAEVCEQEVATTTLRNAIAEDRIGHAYLLCGPRGTGKTTMARIFAKALNCEKGPTPEPCGACERCRATDSGGEIDIIEIDAASNRQIDDVRALRDEVAYAPLRARFKVYIVDEVHMLTTPAFNALLKTLEEPPRHVKFVFATTEPEKLPETIRSRCQILKLGLLREEAIAARLEWILGQERVRPAPGVVEELARQARGSLRDALSITDQLIALSGETPTLEDVRRLAGAGGSERVEAVLAALETGASQALLEALAHTEGSEELLVRALLDHLRGALLAVHAGAQSSLFQAEPAERERRVARGARLGSERIETCMLELLAARDRMRALPEHARLILELTLLDLARAEPSLPLAQLEERLLALEERLSARAGAVPRAPEPASARPAAAPPAAPALAPPAKAPLAAPSAPPPAAPVAKPPPRPAPAPAPERPRPAPPAAIERPPPAARTSERAPVAVLRPAPPPRTSPAANLFAGLVAELADKEPALSAALGRAGKLADLGASSARIQLARLTDEDRAVVYAEGAREACEATLARLSGRPLALIFEDTSKRPPGDSDAFTRSVADLFQGQIEDT